MITGPPPKFHGNRDILDFRGVGNSRLGLLCSVREAVVKVYGVAMACQMSIDGHDTTAATSTLDAGTSEHHVPRRRLLARRPLANPRHRAGSSRRGCAQHLGREAGEQPVGGEAVAELGVGGELASDQLADRPRVCALCVVGRRTEARGLMQGQQAARIAGDRLLGWEEVPGLASSRAGSARR